MKFDIYNIISLSTPKHKEQVNRQYMPARIRLGKTLYHICNTKAMCFSKTIQREMYANVIF